jgi:hypothetical protein
MSQITGGKDLAYDNGINIVVSGIQQTGRQQFGAKGEQFPERFPGIGSHGLPF